LALTPANSIAYRRVAFGLPFLEAETRDGIKRNAGAGRGGHGFIVELEDTANLLCPIGKNDEARECGESAEEILLTDFVRAVSHSGVGLFPVVFAGKLQPEVHLQSVGFCEGFPLRVLAFVVETLPLLVTLVPVRVADGSIIKKIAAERDEEESDE